MRDKRVSVLALQETHLSESHLADLERLYSRLLIINSAHENATSTAGVAIVINKDHITNLDRVKSWEIVPGRALAVQLEWKDQVITFLAVYGPNDKSNSEALWSDIASWWEDNRLEVPGIDVLLGDFNLVEDEIDRAPVRTASVDEAKPALRTLCEKLKVSDGWQNWNPGRLEWTWRRPNSFERSRIDRIYLSETWMGDSRDWSTGHELGGTDHYLVTACLTNHLSPEVGKGRWAMPNGVTEDQKYKDQLKPVAQKLRREAEELQTRPRSSSRNIQHLLESFKDSSASLARQRGKVMGSKAKREIADLNKKRVSVQNDESIDVEEKAAKVQEIESSIEEQQAKQSRQQSDSSKTSNWVFDDANTKYFHRLNKDHKPRDTLKSLKKPGDGAPEWETHSPGMAKVARDFYERLQTVDTNVDDDARNEALDEALNHSNWL
ncbi:DNase I-like protein [Auricularia subglabra TFB-10046 SS5]|uniref:DNase I-like protein n=1 Tax=Auricularia subglabra (strain TFB-10046 / SS5) TaxID=717982 RepID=J0LIA6_AURST|nr:DNase I-like protein [Auricularia subglabra TFB-10046 SS5]